jgi:CheY-like chemotaxis protein
LDGAQKAATLTRQLLAYAGKGRFVVQPINLSEAVEGIAGLLRRTIPKNVELRLELAADPPPIEADVAQMHQLLMNLVINGAEAIPRDESGSVLVITRTQTVDEAYARQSLTGEKVRSGEYVALEIHDTGAGMTPEVQTYMFDPFFTTKFTGRGLGLSAVLGIVRGHRGVLRVYSTPGRGTTFKLLFPVSDRAPRPAAASPSAIVHHASGTVLVVDDEEVVLKTARSVLEKAGYRVLEAGNGRQAVDTFIEQRRAIQAVILDMTMPVLSGEATFREMRAIDASIPVILSSGYNEVEAIRRFAGQGLAGFLQKPYTAGSLIEALERVLRPA